MEEEFYITEEEKLFILKRRELSANRKKLQTKAPKTVKKASPKQANGWDAHCNPCQVHHGRMTEKHPLFWFEEKIFKKISNMQHKDQHKKISKLLGIPVQNVFRDRQYHSLTHLDALWEQQLLPLTYKARYEEYKALHGIGDDNVHPKHKEEKPDYNYPVPNKKRPWDAEKYHCSVNEDFVAGKKYIYEYDKEVNYKYKEA